MAADYGWSTSAATRRPRRRTRCSSSRRAPRRRSRSTPPARRSTPCSACTARCRRCRRRRPRSRNTNDDYTHRVQRRRHLQPSQGVQRRRVGGRDPRRLLAGAGRLRRRQHAPTTSRTRSRCRRRRACASRAKARRSTRCSACTTAWPIRSARRRSPTPTKRRPRAYNVGTLDGHIFQLTGSTSGMNADYRRRADRLQPGRHRAGRDVQVPPERGQTTCRSTRSARPAGTPCSGCSTTPTSTRPLLHGRQQQRDVRNRKRSGHGQRQDFVVSGGTTSRCTPTTTSTPGHHAAAAPTPRPTPPIASTSTPRRACASTSTGSSFDTTLSLHNVQPGEPATARSTNNNDTTATAINVGDIYHQSFQRTGNTSALAHNYDIGCNAGTDRQGRRVQVLAQHRDHRADRHHRHELGHRARPVPRSDGRRPIRRRRARSPPARRTSYARTRTTIGALDGQWYRYSRHRPPRWAPTGPLTHRAARDDSSPDAFFKFTLQLGAHRQHQHAPARASTPCCTCTSTRTSG